MVNPISIGGAATQLSPAELATRFVEARRTGGQIDAKALADDIAALRSGGEDAAADALTAQIESQLTPVQRGEFRAGLDAAAGPNRAELIADVAQIGLDVIGIFDPTPISDGTNAIISLVRGDIGGALMSGAGILPVIGDAAKLGKLGRWAETIAKAADLAKVDARFADAVRPALDGLKKQLDKIDIGGLPLPQAAKDHLTRIKTSVDDALAPAARATGRASTRTFDNVDDFNRAANNAIPNTRYEFGNYSYTTDARGRVSVAEGRVSNSAVGRNDPGLQSQIGREGRDTDVGFHIIADRLGGQTNRLNVVPGNGKPIGDGQPNLNQGAFKRFENNVSKLAEKNDVEVRVEARYDAANASSRPDEFVASYRVNGGRWRTQTFDNK